jgi:hypothetical protein
MMPKYFTFLFLAVLISCTPAPQIIGENPDTQWYKGNLHTHSLWSDGDDYPEMIMDWYQSNDYQFVGLSDHNIIQEGEKWVKVPNNPIRKGAFQAYLDKYGADWVNYREDTSGLEVQLKTLESYRSRFEKPGEFLILKSEEITDSYDGKPIHMNATNVQSLIQPRHGNSMVEVLQNNINAVMEQREATGQPMFPHINHPNFGWAISLEDMQQLKNERFFEVFNGHPAVHNYGDSARIGTEEMWDRINHNYLQKEQELMLGLATDDSHNYHTFGLEYSNVGRGWVMVAAKSLSPEDLIESMEAGHFYASTGVQLKAFGLRNRQYEVEVAPEADVKYEIQIITWKAGAEAPTYMDPVEGTSTTYSVQSDDLFVRAKVISNKAKENPYKTGDREVAWTQPVVL